MKIRRIFGAIDEWLAKPFSPREKNWLGILQKKYIKIFLALVFFAGAWWYEGSWIVAATLLMAIYVHELGHIWAMKSVGAGSKGAWFIPFLGGVAVPGDSSKMNSWDRWLMAVMGPLWGMVMASLPFIFFQYFLEGRLRDGFFEAAKGDRVPIAYFAINWAMIVRDIAILNLLNLLPLPILDGGRMIGELILSFRRKTALVIMAAFLVVAGLMLLKFGSILLAALSVLGALGLLAQWYQMKSGNGMRGAELMIAVCFHAALLLALFFVFYQMQFRVESWEKLINPRLKFIGD